MHNFNVNKHPEAKFNEFKPRLKSPKNRFQLSAGLYFEKFITILSGTNHIWAPSQISTAAQILSIRLQVLHLTCFIILLLYLLLWILFSQLIKPFWAKQLLVD